jgi:hypothetical protein
LPRRLAALTANDGSAWIIPYQRGTMYRKTPCPCGLLPTKSPKHQQLPAYCRVTIAGNFGSEMQRQIALRTLADLLFIWQREVESRHKKNKLTVTSNDQLVC